MIFASLGEGFGEKNLFPGTIFYMGEGKELAFVQLSRIFF